jgi:hypothetical protein
MAPFSHDCSWMKWEQESIAIACWSAIQLFVHTPPAQLQVCTHTPAVLLPHAGFVYRDGSQLKVDGKPWYEPQAGENIHAVMQLSSCAMQVCLFVCLPIITYAFSSLPLCRYFIGANAYWVSLLNNSYR